MRGTEVGFFLLFTLLLPPSPGVSQGARLSVSTWLSFYIALFSCLFLAVGVRAASAGPSVSEETDACLGCHASITPGIVADWERSLHARMSPAEAMKRPKLARRISVADPPEAMAGRVVGCAECHTARPEAHKDTFEHNGFEVHVVVTPKDCATCHPVEEDQYAKNIMSNAYGNLDHNSVFHGLVGSVNGLESFDGAALALTAPDPETNADSCYSCHGTQVEVRGTETRETAMGEMEFPVLTGWPNQGVGRINPDGSKGACTSCHARHGFYIEMARRPHTCSQCHKGPDVPAYSVYSVSKHGNIFSSVGAKWDMGAVPWTVGTDFTAPTCATCHASLVVTKDGEVLVERTHQMNDRIPWRIFGLIYAHAHPKSPDTTRITNQAGLPLPTELTGGPVATALIDPQEQDVRRKRMQGLCSACHSRGWIEGHYARLERTIETTNAMTLTATKILLTAWEKGAAKGLAQKDSIFNEAIEKMWVEQWLFYANSTRFASAMGGADYGVFANGRWYLSRNVHDMAEWLDLRLAAMAEGHP